VTKGATSQTALDYMLSDAAQPVYDCLAKRKVVVTPTLVVYAAVARARSKGAPLSKAFTDFIDGMGRIALRLHQAGITLLSGTDTSDLEAMTILPGSSLLDELEMLQKAGIPPREVIGIATFNAAKTLKLDGRTGAIAAGKDADFLLVSADPGADVGNLRKLVAVYRGGRELTISSTSR
jgi:predicted amidohydrolase